MPGTLPSAILGIGKLGGVMVMPGTDSGTDSVARAPGWMLTSSGCVDTM